MFKRIKESAWYQRNIVANFSKSWAWLASLFGVLIAYGPDLAGFVIEHIDLISAAVPTFPAWAKAIILLIAHGAVLVLRPIKQSNMPPEAVPVAVVNVPAVVAVDNPPGAPVAVPTAVAVQPIDGAKVQAVYERLVPSAPVPEPAGLAEIPGRRLWTFDEFLVFGRDNAVTLVDGMPWSFTFEGRAVTHEHDGLYLINDGPLTLQFRPGDALAVGPGQRIEVLAKAAA